MACLNVLASVYSSTEATKQQPRPGCGKWECCQLYIHFILDSRPVWIPYNDTQPLHTIIVPGRPNAAQSLLALVLAILARTRCCLWFDVMRKTNFAGSSSTNYGAQKERKTLTGGICPLRRFTGHREHANSGGRSYCDGFENGTGVVYAEHVRATESAVDCWCVDCPEHWRLKGS
ncbi:uncharacterized protein CYBJADRAFT_68143 [Cyberlindnera jadinii NRRL Y-1542]|uniref:Uncharacterized protein n=1 Tax=Cyberlindnera jadinii (strain ATCC 18201 / CBS 1600 / BCRC 20928 / JCM 3617 / NBRC 0987 / NRRL Y-1542) TaxID=983966 RepID=A0A1E4S6A0_CYBJN|nr:hypothetical protein CYBJADRAFT_68143 [Cyberlindnera jadinii NRRL Y-1542]ODV75047.1 hypothetical protein CYBJADRAFT_68143 [Cyberlindnera jadinii NRRL Y-1542]